MNRIYKYELSLIDTQTLDLPYAARILSVADQRDEIVLYALVDDEERKTSHHSIRIVGTGHPFPDYDECQYLGTVLQRNGSLVWHIFETTL